MSGARQSPGANALWQSLANRYEAGFVDLREKVLTYLGPEIDDATLGAVHTRMLLLGNGWTLERFKREAQMR
jgi:hypothetical protein